MKFADRTHLAHIIRKATGLEESFDRQAQRFGTHLLEVIATVIAAVDAVRGGAPPPPGGLRAAHAPMLNALLETCLALVDAPHEQTRALARELLDDWDAFWVVLDHPELPFTNNEPSGRCATGSSPGASAWARAPRRAPVPSRSSPASSRPAANVRLRRGPTSPRWSANGAKDLRRLRCRSQLRPDTAPRSLGG
ncbi:transposase [Thiorhodococcus minor]|uniref:Transposase n=1 Tax=Thiorhodococcus minor TaxID=57489 RepID=A0A6M0KA05_9GAMM|nr:transposase [Thiorhodococcus minor]